MKRSKIINKEVNEIAEHIKKDDESFYVSYIKNNYKTESNEGGRKKIWIMSSICSALVVISLCVLLPFFFKGKGDEAIEYQGKILYSESNINELNNSLTEIFFNMGTEGLIVSRMYDDITGDTLFYKVTYEDYENFEFYEIYFYVNQFFRDKQSLIGASSEINVSEYIGKYKITKTIEVEEFSEAIVETSFGMQSMYMIYSSYTQDVSLNLENVMNHIIKKK